MFHLSELVQHQTCLKKIDLRLFFCLEKLDPHMQDIVEIVKHNRWLHVGDALGCVVDAIRGNS